MDVTFLPVWEPQAGKSFHYQRGYSRVQSVCHFLRLHHDVSTKTKGNQDEINTHFCNKDWFWYCFICSQHILKITHGHLLNRQQSTKTSKIRILHTQKAQNRDYVEPLWKTVWLSLNWQSYAWISEEFSFLPHVTFSL